MTSQTEADPTGIPDLRCAFCAEPVMYVTISNFNGWVHDYTAIEERLKRASKKVIKKALEADPARCCNAEGLLSVDIFAGTYDSRKPKYTTEQERLNKFKVVDHALKVYFSDEIVATGATWAAIVHAGSDGEPASTIKKRRPRKLKEE